jgi:hypothetical protein
VNAFSHYRMFLALLSFFLTLSSIGLSQDAPAFDASGLANYRIGIGPPAESGFEGLTHKEVVQVEQAEGETYRTNYLKLFLNGIYLGKARLGGSNQIEEITIVSPLVRHEAGYAVGTTFDTASRSFPEGKLFYTYVSDALWTESKSVGPLQLHFDKSAYKGNEELRWELQEIKEADFDLQAKITKIRLYRN